MPKRGAFLPYRVLYRYSAEASHSGEEIKGSKPFSDLDTAALFAADVLRRGAEATLAEVDQETRKAKTLVALVPDDLPEVDEDEDPSGWDDRTHIVGLIRGVATAVAEVVPVSGEVVPAAPVVVSGVVVPASLVDYVEPWHVIVSHWIAAQTSDRTAEGYARETRMFTEWCAARGVDPRVIRRHDVEAYRNERTLAGDSARTLARRLSAVSSLYTYGGGYGLPANPVTGVKRPKIDRSSSPSQSLGRDEVPRLLAVAEADGARSGALVALLVLAGLRVSEALAADVEDLGHDHGHRTLTIRAKGGAEAKIPLAPAVARAVERAVGDRTAGPILATSTGGRLDRRHAHRTVQRLAKAAGVEGAEDIGPHDLRHTAVTGVLEMTGSIDAGQRFARHASPVTTQGYDHRRRTLDDHPGYGLAAHFSATAGW